jgi:hypothetical protein
VRPPRSPSVAAPARSVTRTLALAAALALAACGETRLTTPSVPTGVGPDAILLRVPMRGGTVRAYRAGRDSALWESRDRAPAAVALLGFDEFLGLLIGEDANRRVFSVDLRLGGVEALGTATFPRTAQAEGAAVFGLDANDRVLRVTPVATWSWAPPGGATHLVPHPDGSLVLVRSDSTRARLGRLIPPETQLTDSATLPTVHRLARTPVGDRIWFVTDSGLIAVRSRDLTRAVTVRIGDPVTVIEPTPSGDRLYVATTRSAIRVVDRFAEEVRGRIDLPAPATALRMDPDGRYLLARTAAADSFHVVSVGTERVVATLHGTWREDLPLVTPDGRVLLARDADVVQVDAETGRERMRYRGGATDHWRLVRWNGFRPRAVGLDQPVEFEEYAADSAAAERALATMMASRYGDPSSIMRIPGESEREVPPGGEPGRTAGAPPGGRPGAPEAPRPTGRETWTVSFATLLAEDRAVEMAERIRVDGRSARVVAGNRDGIPIWRVVLGPYDSRDAAERAGMASRLPYWVFEGVP